MICENEQVDISLIENEEKNDHIESNIEEESKLETNSLGVKYKMNDEGLSLIEIISKRDFLAS